MKVIRNIFITLLSLLLLAGGVAGYAFFIEPNIIVKHTHHLESKSSSGEDTIRIIQISDIHISEAFTEQQLDKLVDKINKSKPDIVVFTGDLYDNYAVDGSVENTILSLSNIQSNYGKFAVWGNRDYGGGAERFYAEIMENSGFMLLKNQGAVITTETGKQLFIGGVDDFLLGNPSIEETLSQGSAESDYSIVLMHEPDPADAFMGTSVDLLLAGHSHGGQVYIPFDAGVTTTLAENYQRGFHTIDDHSKMQLYVSTGIGTTNRKVRLGVPPEIAIFEIAV